MKATTKTRRTLRRILIAVVAIISVAALAGAKGCEESSQHPSMPQPAPPPRVQPTPQVGTPNPKEGDPTPHREVIVRAGEVEPQFLPATISIYASPLGFAHDEPMTSSNSVKFRFEVPEGMTVTVNVTVKPAKPGSKSGWCSIESGRLKDGPRIVNGGWHVICNLVIPA